VPGNWVVDLYSESPFCRTKQVTTEREHGRIHTAVSRTTKYTSSDSPPVGDVGFYQKKSVEIRYSEIYTESF
jgi:hypothetical protein